MHLMHLLDGRIQALSSDLHLWMTSNQLSLNSSKIQLVWFGTPPTTSETSRYLLNTFPIFTIYKCSVSARDIGVRPTLDSSLIFSEHITNLKRSSYY